MTETIQQVPAKGTVWLHAKRTEYDGSPLRLTVTSITQGKVYSKTDFYTRVKTPIALFQQVCLEIVSVPEPGQGPGFGPKLSYAECEALFAKGHAAGLAAGENARPVPMQVVQRVNPLDDTSPITVAYAPVMDGACGFAYVTVRPGNSAFARYIKQYRGAFKAYYGGVQFSVHEFNQSLARKTAYANAFVRVLEAAGIRAYVESRMD